MTTQRISGVPKVDVRLRTDGPGSLERLTYFVPWLLTLGLGAVTFLSLPWGLGFGPVAIISCALLLGMMTAFLVRSLPHDAPWIPAGRHWLIGIILAGCVLRITMILVVPPIQLSDAHAYVNLARGMLVGEGYQQRVGEHLLRAWRPPGLRCCCCPSYG
jgi:hypothetical protein